MGTVGCQALCNLFRIEVAFGVASLVKWCLSWMISLRLRRKCKTDIKKTFP